MRRLLLLAAAAGAAVAAAPPAAADLPVRVVVTEHGVGASVDGVGGVGVGYDGDGCVSVFGSTGPCWQIVDVDTGTVSTGPGLPVVVNRTENGVWFAIVPLSSYPLAGGGVNYDGTVCVGVGMAPYLCGDVTP